MQLRYLISSAAFGLLTLTAVAFQGSHRYTLCSRAPLKFKGACNSAFTSSHFEKVKHSGKCRALFSSESAESPPDKPSVKEDSLALTPEPSTNIFTSLKNLLQGKGRNGQSLNKESISKLGLNCLLAYGFVSNVSYITCLILAWITHGKSTRLSPLAPGQWKKFLIVYATFFAANNVLRPLRFSLSLVLTPAFDSFVDVIQKRTGWTRRNSTAMTVFLVNICGTFSYLFGGLFIATTLAKVPLLP